MKKDTDIFVDEREIEGTKEDNSTEELDDNKINGYIMEFVYNMMRGKMSVALENEIIDILKYAYQNKYRHSYYEISNAIYQSINDSTIGGDPLESLVNNVEIIKDKAFELYKDDEDVCKGFRKFYDHIMLEVTRINDHVSNMKNINGLIKEFEEKIKQESKENRSTARRIIMRNTKRLELGITNRVEKITTAMKKLEDDIFSQLVAILGIFSAIIIVFFGGASIFAKVLEKIGDINWIDAGPVLAITGFVMFNFVFMFLFIVSRMIDKDIGAKVEKNSIWEKNTILLWLRRYPYMFFFNSLMIAIFVISLMQSEVSEKKNEYIEYESVTECIEETAREETSDSWYIF